MVDKKETNSLTEREQQRYLRQLQLPVFAKAGQLALKNSRVLIVGVGGLGCPAAQYLVAAGVGHITLVDGDEVSLSNLQRQILFNEHDIGHNKAQVAQKKLQQLNSDITVLAHANRLTLDNALPLIEGCDLVLDCTDNFQTRFLINDVCYIASKPWVYASVLGFGGQVALFNPKISCFRCLFPEVNDVPDCNQAGVLGVVPGSVGLFQATQAIKYLSSPVDAHSVLAKNQLLQFDALGNRLSTFGLQREPSCIVCSGGLTTERLTQWHQGSNQYLEPEYFLQPDEFLHFCQDRTVQLIDVRSPQEHSVFNLGGLNIPVQECLQWQGWQPRQSYVLYCQSGQRSEALLKQLKTHPFLQQSTIKTLVGGVDAIKNG